MVMKIKNDISGIVDDVILVLPIVVLIYIIKFFKILIFGREEKDPYRSKVEVREAKVEIRENEVFNKEG